MFGQIRLINVAFAFWALAFSMGCSPAVKLPSVHEPIDSQAWKTCASDLEAREAVGMIDDLTLDAKTMLCKGVARAAAGEVEDGLELLVESSVRDKEDHRPYYLSGRILVEAGRYEEALTAFERSMKRFSSLEVPTERLGRKVLEKEGQQKACGFLAKAYERKLCPYGCMGLLARLYFKNKETDKARAIYNEMIKQSPGEPAAYVGLAAIGNADSNHSREASLLEDARASKHFAHLSDSQRADILYSLAFARYNNGEYPRAAKVIEQAIAYRKDMAEWCLLAGWIEMKQDHPEDAYSWFEKATTIDTRLAAAYAGRGDAKAALDEMDNAMGAYEKARDLDPTNTVFVLKAAHAAAKTGDLEKARQLVDEATRLDPEHLPHELLGKVTDLLKDTEAPKAPEAPK